MLIALVVLAYLTVGVITTAAIIAVNDYPRLEKTEAGAMAFFWPLTWFIVFIWAIGKLVEVLADAAYRR